MKTLFIALLLMVTFPAAAICYSHPTTQITYCYYASECPYGTQWNQQTQACEVPINQPVEPQSNVTTGNYWPAVGGGSGISAIKPQQGNYTRVDYSVVASASIQIRTAWIGPVTVLILAPTRVVTNLAGVVTGSSYGTAEQNDSYVILRFDSTTYEWQTLNFIFSYVSE